MCTTHLHLPSRTTHLHGSTTRLRSPATPADAEAYCRLGFDPREEPSDALRRQVIAFKDRSRSGRESMRAVGAREEPPG